MASIASPLPNRMSDYWNNCNPSTYPEVNPSKVVVIDCNTASANLRRRKRPSNVKSVGFGSVLLEKQQRIRIYRVSLSIPSVLNIPSDGCLDTSLNVRDEVKLKLVAWDIWKSGGRSGGDKGSHLVVEVELGVEEDEGSHNQYDYREDDDECTSTTSHSIATEGNPILQGRHSNCPPLPLFRSHLHVTDPVQIEDTTLEFLKGKILLRIPYHNETYELHSFCDDEDEKYGNRYRCWTGEEVAQLKCRLCGIEFLPSSTSSSPLRVFQLPSGHFDDIVDDMICFEGPTAVPMTAREVAFARKGLLLMGDSFCLLHPSDTHVGMIDTTTVVKNVEEGEEEQSDEGPEREWHMDSIQKMARCGRCNYWLGDVIPTPYQEGSESAASTEIHAAEGGGGFLLHLHRILGVPWFRKRSEDAAESPASYNIPEKQFPLSSLLFQDYRATHWLLHKVRKAALVDRHFTFLIVVKDWRQGKNKGVWQDRGIFLHVINAESLISTSEDLPPMRAVSVQFCIVGVKEMKQRTIHRIWVRPDEFDDILNGLDDVSGFVTQMDRHHLSICSTVGGESCEKRLSFLL